MAMERPAEFPKAIPFNANEVSAARDWIRRADRASRLNPNCNLGLFYVRIGTRLPQKGTLRFPPSGYEISGLSLPNDSLQRENEQRDLL